MAKTINSPLYVGDVYELAADIGQAFDKLIKEYGSDIFTTLTTNVIITLEYLENSIITIDSLQNELYELKTKVQQLEYEKLEKAEFRSKLDQELEIIEDNWRKEISQLNSLVIKLQEENKRLTTIIAEKETPSPNDCKTFLSDEDLAVVKNLKELTEQHRAQLIVKDKELLEKSNELEKVELEVERLSKVNKELSHKNRHLQQEMYTLVEEKADMQANIQHQQREFTDLQGQLSIALKENMDLSSIEVKQQLDLKGKVIMNVDDPNRPRFTLDELRHILYERNNLKAKISDLEEELSMYQQRSSSSSAVTANNVKELPVQGPINKEPEDKLYPGRKKLGIRRFFPTVTWPKLV